MSDRHETPLTTWEAKIWVVGIAVAIAMGAAVVVLAGAGFSAWLIGAVMGGFICCVTTAGALITRRAYEHQIRLQDEAESVRSRFMMWADWLPKSESFVHSLQSARLPLTPQSLAEFAMISDRVRAVVLKLQYDRAEASAVLANLEGGVISLDPKCRITLINETAKKFFQIDRPCLGHPLIQSIRQPEVIDSVQKVFRDRAPRDIHLETRSDDGLRRTLRVRCSSIRYGDVGGVLITAHDESETRRIEEVRREFVANVSHELKTPLAAIKGYAETVELALGDDPEAAKHFVSQIHGQCKRLERLIADMMTLARAQAGTQHLRLTTVDLEDIVAESIATYAPVAVAKQMSLVHKRSSREFPNSTIVYADREATLTIANNVIGNAIRYTAEGGTVVVSCRSEGRFGVLKVQDNGIGIPENEQKRIFERFYRVDKSRKYERSGTGLGLSIVKNLTQSQGGEVQLRSRPGEGSVFEIYLPCQSAGDLEGMPGEMAQNSTIIVGAPDTRITT
jgi:two-component system phosphate regulon sensor histidine kinase PhoR